MSKKSQVFLLEHPLRDAVDKLSSYCILEYKISFSFLMFKEIFSFFCLDLEEDSLWEYWRLFASTIVHHYSCKEIPFEDWCWIIFLIIKSLIKNVHLDLNSINTMNRNNNVNYKICLKVSDLLSNQFNSEEKTKPFL